MNRPEVAGLLEEYRLVTVTGPGGVGKTRLAGEVARWVAARFADGVWLAELAPVRDPVRVAPAVAVALGVREQPGMPAADALMRVLARRQLLVVLDNCEHVIEEAAQLCAGLLAACDDVRIVATSRERLRIAGEVAYRLAPLPVPGPGDDSAGAEAVTLFADRARAADAGFALTDQNRADVARLVRAAGRIPLAIELARRGSRRSVSPAPRYVDHRVALLRSAGTGWRLGGTGRWRLPRGRLQLVWSAVLRPPVGVPGRVHLRGGRGGRGQEQPPAVLDWSSARCWSRRGPGRWPVPVRDAARRCVIRGQTAGRGRRAGSPRRCWPGMR